MNAFGFVENLNLRLRYKTIYISTSQKDGLDHVGKLLKYKIWRKIK